MTVEQKEQISSYFTMIYMKFFRANELLSSMEKWEWNSPASVVNTWSKEIREEIESGERYVDKLKQYLMEIDREERYDNAEND